MVLADRNRIDGFKNEHRNKFFRMMAENKIPQGIPYIEPEIPAEWLEEVCANYYYILLHLHGDNNNCLTITFSDLKI